MELLHVLNRGVDGRKLFMNDLDRIRFVHNLYEFNDTAPADPNISYHFKSMDIVSPYIKERRRERLVDIHGWCLMNEHYHLLLSELVEGGLSLFLRKLNIGYSKYYNEKYHRSGTLFQSRTKKILIEHESHFLYILHYIHLNPLDYLPGSEEWRVRDHSDIRTAKEALEYLDTYRWSSYLDYAETKNFPSILTTSLFKEALGDITAATCDYLRDAEYGATLAKLTLE